MLYLFLMSIPMAIVSVYIAYADVGAVSAVRLRAARLGHHADERSAPGRPHHVDPRRASSSTPIISVVFFRWQQRDGVESRAGAQVDWHAA